MDIELWQQRGLLIRENLHKFAHPVAFVEAEKQRVENNRIEREKYAQKVFLAENRIVRGYQHLDNLSEDERKKYKNDQAAIRMRKYRERRASKKKSGAAPIYNSHPLFAKF